MTATVHSCRRGALLVLEGVDRAGKSTQAKRLLRWLNENRKECKVELWRFPDRSTNIGSTIDNYLQGSTNLSDAAVHLLFAANRWEKYQLMMDKLNEGTTLIIDR